MNARTDSASARADHRLRTPAQFAAVAAARGASGWRAARRWLAINAALAPAGAGGVRLGLTVPKRMARRAIDRNLCKRVARAALQAARPALDACCAARQQRVDLIVRLKSPLPPVAAYPRTRWRAELRAEADALLGALLRELQTRPVALPAAVTA